ncbi:hypothetical protein CPB83DRAFT_844435 [Crepidotus variabilis]|uniref:Uncharacterized protein n=1 Tax=Crepidotus variabilis TaxID=179855 RepID=A0A9P6ERC0_9AGAR|nr:hypothetical protein CPB83DRAFT_844435 [Crepidotus variabilis]
MTSRFNFVLPIILIFLLLVNAQSTVTTLNAAGQTVIEVITTNPQGIAITQIISTVATTAAVTTTPPAQAPIQPGPVAQPAASGTPGAPTPFTYTTIVGGVTNTVVAIFTPTSPATTPVTAPAIGTIYDYSSWLSVYGPPKSGGDARRSRTVHCSLIALVLGVVGWAMW